MKQKTTEALIVTRSVALQQGLGALLESLPGISNVKASKELSHAYAWIESHHPGIVLLDAALTGNDPRAVLEKIQAISSQTKRVLLVDQVEQMKWVPHYAEAILIRGIAPSAVATILTDLLSTKGEENEHSDPNQ